MKIIKGDLSLTEKGENLGFIREHEHEHEKININQWGCIIIYIAKSVNGGHINVKSRIYRTFRSN